MGTLTKNILIAVDGRLLKNSKIYELKTRTGVRVLSFFGEGKSLILTHGFFKPTKKKLQIEIGKAAEWERTYQESIKSKKKDKR